MNTGVADRFLNVFTTYIDSGFGLVGGEVAFLATTLVVIDMTLAALFWAWSSGEDVLARLIRKTLYVGFFAFLIGNFPALASIVLESFSGLGLQAAGGGLVRFEDACEQALRLREIGRCARLPEQHRHAQLNARCLRQSS